jgi:hypothetical protein
VPDSPTECQGRFQDDVLSAIAITSFKCINNEIEEISGSLVDRRRGRIVAFDNASIIIEVTNGVQFL